VYVALLDVSLERVPTGFPNAVCRLHVTSTVLPVEIVTVTDWPWSKRGLLEGVTNWMPDCAGGFEPLLQLRAERQTNIPTAK